MQRRRIGVMVFNHGGFSGLGGEWDGGLWCEAAVEAGYVALQSSYRGEDGSDGRIELCEGEVDDVLAMMDVGLAQPYADPRRVVMIGGSHGGCVTLRAIARGAPVHAAVAIAPPTDLATLHRFWENQISDPSLSSASRSYYVTLREVVETALGGEPATVPSEYARRSPLNEVDSLSRFGGALFIVHGTNDALVPPGQACRLAVAMGSMTAFRQTTAGDLTTSAPYGCGGIARWHTGPHPAAEGWPRSSYLGIVDGAGHGNGARWGSVLYLTGTFSAAHTP